MKPLEQEEIKRLIRTAKAQLDYSYAPYSHFHVGAALLAKNGNIYTGCNIENAGYTPCNCAERTAFFKAVSEGKREFSAIAIVGGPAGKEPEDFCPPCGVCRQVMMEFCDPDRFRIVLGKKDLSFREYTLKELLPLGFAGSGVERKE